MAAVGARDYFQAMIWPTAYGFVGHIMLIYVLLYWLLKPPSRWPFLLVLLALGAAYFYFFAVYFSAVPAHQPLFLGHTDWQIHFVYFSFITLFGALLAPATRRPIGTFSRDLLLLIVMFAVYVAVKYAMVVKGIFPRWFILLQILTALNCVLILRVSAADLPAALLAPPLARVERRLAGRHHARDVHRSGIRQRHPGDSRPENSVESRRVLDHHHRRCGGVVDVGGNYSPGAGRIALAGRLRKSTIIDP